MSEIPARLLMEWLDGNQHRAYPLDESTSGANAAVPYPLLVDALFSVTSGIDTTRLFISKIVTGAVGVSFWLKGYLEGGAELIDFGEVASVSLDPEATPPGTSVPIAVTTATYSIEGSIVIGDISSVLKMPANTTLTLETGKFFPGCVRVLEKGVTGLEVNGEVFTGLVTLEAGEGIEFDTSTTAVDGIIKINATGYVLPEDWSQTIRNDTELMTEAVEAFGLPVRSIQGFLPDQAGNISIVDPPVESSASSDESDSSDEGGGSAYVTVISANNGAIAITLANDDTITACDDDITVTVNSLMSSVANINDRLADIDTGITALDRANNNLAIQLSRY